MAALDSETTLHLLKAPQWTYKKKLWRIISQLSTLREQVCEGGTETSVERHNFIISMLSTYHRLFECFNKQTRPIQAITVNKM